MNPPARRRAAAVVTAAGPPQEQRSGNGAAAGAPVTGQADKALTAQSLQEFARLKKLERERKREDEAARLRAAKLAAAATRSGEAGRPAWNPAAPAAGRGRDARPGRSQDSNGASLRPAARAGSLNSRPSSSADSSGSSSCGGAAAGSAGRAPGGEERQSISSSRAPAVHDTPAPAVQEAAREAPPLVPRLVLNGSVNAGGGLLSGRESGSGWSPRKVPRAQQAGGAGGHVAAAAARPLRSARVPQQHTQALAQPPLPSARLGSLSARAPPAGQQAATLRRQQQQVAATTDIEQRTVLPPPPPPLAAPAATLAPDAELDSAELEARRVQQLIEWGALLVQAAATAAAERVLLGPAALPESQPLLSAELPLSFGQQQPTQPAARAAAAQQQVAAALAALEQQRQLKLQLLAAAEQGGTLSAADRQLMLAEAAADLQAQGLLAHWGVQAASDARKQHKQQQQQEQQLEAAVEQLCLG